MNFAYKIVIPTTATKAAPEKLLMPLDYGIITHVIVQIPDGQKETAHVMIKYHEAQLYPLNRGAYYAGDGSTVEFDDKFPMIVAPYELKAEGYNESDTYEHAILMNFNVLRPEDIGWKKIPEASIARLYKLLGTEVEIEPEV